MATRQGGHRLLVMTLACLVGLTILTAVAWHGTQPLAVDRIVARAVGVSSWTASRHDRLALFVVGLGTRWPLAVACLAAFLTAVICGRGREAALPPLATVIAVGATSVLKLLVDRRFAWDRVGGRFPSGHAAGVAALAAATVVVWACPHDGRATRPRTVTAFAVVTVLLVGWELVVTRAHSPVDVMAGWLVGVAAATGLGAIGQAWTLKRSRLGDTANQGHLPVAGTGRGR